MPEINDQIVTTLLPFAQQCLVTFTVAAGGVVIDHAELVMLLAVGRVFQPDDNYAPLLAEIPNKVERLEHFLAGIRSTIAVPLSAAGLTYLPDSDA
jgi:hypothetical protein